MPSMFHGEKFLAWKVLLQEYVWRTTPIYMWHKQAIIKWWWCAISIVACCHSVKLCAHVAWAFQSQQNGAVTRMWRSCCVKPSQKERVIGAVHCNKEGYCCNLSTGIVLNAQFTTNRMCANNNTHIYVAWRSNNRVVVARDLYCCLLPQCEALRTCRSGFPIATVLILIVKQVQNNKVYS